MIYDRRWVLPPDIPTPPPTLPVTTTEPVVKKGKPMDWKGNGNFDIGQECADGSHNFDGQHIVNVTDMTPAQLSVASDELTYEQKREAIAREELDQMQDIANESDTTNEFIEGCQAEPNLNRSETPAYDHYLGDQYTTISAIRLSLAGVSAELNTDIATKKALQIQIADLAGTPMPEPPTDECQLGAAIDKLNHKVSDMVDELGLAPYDPPAAEPVPDIVPGTIPDSPTVPTLPEAPEGGDYEQFMRDISDYLTAQRAYDDGVEFNIGWALEEIRVCLQELEAARVRGTGTDNYEKNLEALEYITDLLETQGIFHD